LGRSHSDLRRSFIQVLRIGFGELNFHFVDG
jgi:hypothetical protein